MQQEAGSRHVILSGCSGGGKSTLIEALAKRGYRTVEEPGRRIVAEELCGEGAALPWVNLDAFARRALDMACLDRIRVAGEKGWGFFDRGLIDAAAALQHASGCSLVDTLGGQPRFHAQVFLTPPWPELYRTDGERQHDLASALEEYERLLQIYPALGYDVVILPKTDVPTRAEFVLDHLRAFEMSRDGTQR